MTTRADLIRYFLAGVEAVGPERLVSSWLTAHPVAASHVVAIGKAAGGMAVGASRLVDAEEWLVVAPHDVPVPTGARLVIAGHPTPNEESFAAGRLLVELADSMGEEDHLLVLLSGGASSLAEAPTEGISLVDVVRATEILLASGASIEAVNAVRGAMSRLKGGGLAALAHPAEVTTLAISDVVGSDPGAIGSGPTVAGRSKRALDVLANLREVLPRSVVQAVLADHAVSPTPGEYHVLADGGTAAEAAAAAARRDGSPARVVTTGLTGEAALVAPRVVEDLTRRGGDGIFVYAGETTVTLDGRGRGGRNQEAALAAALALDGQDGMTFLAAGTDGIDGPTENAGAVVDGTSAAVMRAAGVDPMEALENHDSACAHESAGTAVITGPTGTNVGDLWLVHREPDARTPT